MHNGSLRRPLIYAALHDDVGCSTLEIVAVACGQQRKAQGGANEAIVGARSPLQELVTVAADQVSTRSRVLCHDTMIGLCSVCRVECRLELVYCEDGSSILTKAPNFGVTAE